MRPEASEGVCRTVAPCKYDEAIFFKGLLKVGIVTMATCGDRPSAIELRILAAVHCI